MTETLEPAAAREATAQGAPASGAVLCEDGLRRPAWPPSTA